MLRSVCLCLDLCVYAPIGKSKRGVKGTGNGRRTSCTCSLSERAGRCCPRRTPCIGTGNCGSRLEALVQLLETRRHGVVLVCLARLAFAPDAIVLTDARPSALLAPAPFSSVLADARPSALLASAPYPSVLADARPSALLAVSYTHLRAHET